MDEKTLNDGLDVPNQINAIVEIPKGEGRIKYEYRENGQMVIDRIRSKNLPMYPIHYGGFPGTQSPDGDPLDVLILGDDPLKTGDVIKVRPVAVMWMTDEEGKDPKIICVPDDSLTDDYLNIRTLSDIPEADKQRIEKFFNEYKKGDVHGRWSKVEGWDDLAVAHKIVLEGVARWKKNVAPAVSTSAKPQTPASLKLA